MERWEAVTVDRELEAMWVVESEWERALIVGRGRRAAGAG